MGSNKNTAIIMSVKMVLMSTGILSIAILLSFFIPNLFTFATSHLPSLFSTLRTTWLRPPFLYFIINAIIITIVFLHNHHNSRRAPPPYKAKGDVISAPPAEHFSPYDVVSVTDNNYDVSNDNVSVVFVKDVEVVDAERDRTEIIVDDDNHHHRREMKSTVTDERSTWDPPSSTPPLKRQGAVKKLFSSDRPPTSSRFGANHRRPTKPILSEGGKALKVFKPKKQDTLDSTWKTITAGRHVPLNRHLKKSDTWEDHSRQIDVLNDSPPLPTVVKKSETYKDRTNYTTPRVTSTKLKKEPSLGQDELNRRVEAFINKFNEDMKLQRQESLQQFMEMINRAA